MKRVSLTILTLVTTAVAQNGMEELYDPKPPANSAFVRVANIPSATLGSRAVTALRGAASSYVVVPQGEFTARAGASTRKLKVVAGQFYTVVQTGGTLALLPDQAFENRTKALLTVYNLSASPSVALKTADGQTAVVSGVKPGQSGNRAVNGITVDLAAFAGSKVLGTLKGVKLERGNAYALVVTDRALTITVSSTRTK